MPRGHPDWQVNTGQFSFLDLDTAEAMVRIGSPASISRSGRVVWLTGFECDLHDVLNGDTGTGAVSRDTTYPFRGSACVKMLGTFAAGGFAWLSKRIPPLSLSRIGLEFNAWFYDIDGILDFGVEVQSPTLGYKFKFYLYADDGIVKLVDDTAGTVTLGNLGGDLWDAAPYYLNVKVVVDALTGKYAYIRVNDVVFDAGAYTAAAMAAAHPGIQRLWLHHASRDVDTSVLYLDDLIFTIDEP